MKRRDGGGGVPLRCARVVAVLAVAYGNLWDLWMWRFPMKLRHLRGLSYLSERIGVVVLDSGRSPELGRINMIAAGCRPWPCFKAKRRLVPKPCTARTLWSGSAGVNRGTGMKCLIKPFWCPAEMRRCNCRTCRSLWELMELMDVAISNEVTTSPRAKLLIRTYRSCCT